MAEFSVNLHSKQPPLIYLSYQLTVRRLSVLELYPSQGVLISCRKTSEVCDVSSEMFLQTFIP